MWLYHFGRFVAWIPMRIFYPTKVIGTVKLPKGKVIVACNHQSYLDAMILATRTSRPVRFMAKSQLFKNWFTKWLFNTIECIPVDRKGNDFVAMRKVLKSLKDGNAFGLFPEGTRSLDERKMLDLKNGVCLFAIKSQAPVIPMVFAKKPKLFKMNYLMIGEAIDFSETYSPKVSTEKVNEATNVLQDKMFGMKASLVAKLDMKKGQSK